MSEWQLFDGDDPACSTLEFFQNHPWVSPEDQAGHAERTAMVASLVREVVGEYAPASITDLGCGDGSLIDAIGDLPVAVWGYDAGPGNVEKAHSNGLDVRRGDILSASLELGELIVCCEVVEHLARPRQFLRDLPARLLVVSSPSAETGEWHYADHAWAWDVEGYAALLHDAGWDVRRQVECDGGVNWHGGVTRPQRFQAIFATRSR
jgi:trans-aconitate methyltransferase